MYKKSNHKQQVRVLLLVWSFFSCIAQMKRWKAWEEETSTLEYQLSNGNFRYSSPKHSFSVSTFLIIQQEKLLWLQWMVEFWDWLYAWIRCCLWRLVFLCVQCSVTETNFERDADPRRFKLTRQTSFGERHLKIWSNHHLFIWIVS